MLRRPLASVAAAFTFACSQPSHQSTGSAASTSLVVPAPQTDAGALVSIAPDAATAPMNDHFIFHGPRADRAAARARVARAFVHQAADPKAPHGMFTTLDEQLNEQYVDVTPEGATLRLIISPAVGTPSWEMDCTVDADDHITNLIVAQIAPAPRP